MNETDAELTVRGFNLPFISVFIEHGCCLMSILVTFSIVIAFREEP